MNYKRVEMYIGWTCNQKCTYCREYEHMEKFWDKKITKYDILKKLIKYKKQGYNHVTYLGGEPFIQEVFLDALKLAKKLNYTILVTTNCTTLYIEKEAKKYLLFIDELIISVEAIDKDLQQKISRTKVFVEWEKVFENINKYWKGNFLKANIVITQDNLQELYNIVKYLFENNIKNIAITYPDCGDNYYNEEHLLNLVMLKYFDLINIIIKIIDFSENNKINLKIVDFPFCIFPNKYLNKIIKLSDDYDYEERLKIEAEDEEDFRDSKDDFPRERKKIKKCKKCKYKNLCWGPGIEYIKLYGDTEINPIK